MSPSKLSFHDQHHHHHNHHQLSPPSSRPAILNLTSYSNSLTSNSPSCDDDGRSSNNSPSNLNNIFGAYGESHANTCAQCSSSFLTRDLLEKHEMMHISNATMVSSFFQQLRSFYFFLFFVILLIKPFFPLDCCCNFSTSYSKI